MKTFSKEVRTKAYEAYNGYCCVYGCTNKSEEMHHAFPNTKLNNKLFPLFIQSEINCKPVCKKCHVRYTYYNELRISEAEAQMYESMLSEIKQNG